MLRKIWKYCNNSRWTVKWIKIVYANWSIYLVEEWQYTLCFHWKLVFIRNYKRHRFIQACNSHSTFTVLNVISSWPPSLRWQIVQISDRSFPKSVRPFRKYSSYSRSALRILAVQSLSLYRGGDGVCDRSGCSIFEGEFRWFVFVHRAGVWLWKFCYGIGVCTFAIPFFDASCSFAEIR